MKHKFFVGPPHQKIHSRFIHRLLGGEYVEHPCTTEETNFPDSVLAHDGPDTIWFFNDIYFHLHPKLKGKQVFVGHGFGLGWAMTPARVECLNRYFDSLFETGLSPEIKDLARQGVDPSKIRRTGYTLLFEMPDVPTETKRILFSITCYLNFNSDANLEQILKRLDPALHGSVTVHPELPADMRDSFRKICGSKNNLNFIESQEELLSEFARCQCVVGQFSSVVTPFYFQKKPVIFLRGRVARNPFLGLGWARVRRRLGSALLDQVLDESTKISHWRQFNPKLVEQAKLAPSAQKIFFSSNYDKEKTSALIREYVRELAVDRA